MFNVCRVCAHRCELPKLFRDYRVGVEVGVMHGNYSVALLSRWPGYLHLIDPWAPDPLYIEDRKQDHQYNFDLAMRQLKPYLNRAHVYREKDSEELAQRIGSVDFAYIDGNHAYDFVMDDMHIWWGRVRPGGILAGHDLFNMEHPNVTWAVMQFAASLHKDVTVVQGKQDCPCGEGGLPSWYIRK